MSTIHERRIQSDAVDARRYIRDALNSQGTEGVLRILADEVRLQAYVMRERGDNVGGMRSDTHASIIKHAEEYVRGVK